MYPPLIHSCQPDTKRVGPQVTKGAAPVTGLQRQMDHRSDPFIQRRKRGINLLISSSAYFERSPNGCPLDSVEWPNIHYHSSRRVCPRVLLPLSMRFKRRSRSISDDCSAGL
ncbi:hypothetical protein CEXT_619231 [Caerostris extrusa]|uniref:Uncharacterized protein n=1 Tax=Caerostris extrusa TaxID=172846 RepID=A0AAV4S9D3_CAEEX|nr:hypothetical protein CEXT_619231 [Caerostris extrusa]